MIHLTPNNFINLDQGDSASPLNCTLQIKFKIVLSLSLQPSWICVDFDNWRDWEHEEDDGKEEYERYMDVSTCNVLQYINSDSVHELRKWCMYLAIGFGLVCVCVCKQFRFPFSDDPRNEFQ